MPASKLTRTFPQRLIHATSDPTRIYAAAKLRVGRLLGEKVFIATERNRSESDNGSYVAFVQSASLHYKQFRRFKRHPSYRAILEHTNESDGWDYLRIVREQSPEFLDLIDRFKQNDLIGAPITYDYPGIGAISPGTLRYMKVASDLKNLFGSDIGQRIAEIGVGYGGQLLISDQVFGFKEYDLFDLPPVLSLVSRYLECHILNGSYRGLTLNQSAGGEEYDLVVSNYAFSELPSQLQLKYIDKVMARAKRGYLTMNSGVLGSAFGSNKLTIEELRRHLPSFEILPETPLTAPNNYIVVWGHQQ